MTPWLGDSVGWYEGETLVVETVNPNPWQRGVITASGKLTERFSRWSDDQILYEFTVEDLSLYTQPWKGEMSFHKSSRAPLRIRLSRRKLCDGGHTRGSSRSGAGRAVGGREFRSRELRASAAVLAETEDGEASS
jgi:hypothetical protein